MAKQVRRIVGVALWVVTVLLLLALRISHVQEASAQQPAASGALITGKSTVLSTEGITTGRRSFEPSGRTYWHSHPGGQLILIESGRALVQERGKPIRQMGPGDTIFSGPNVLHWHGATPTQSMTQVNIGFPGGPTKWMEAVTDAQYAGKAQ
jgi:quercetin dioxygenase-like cupin family protein